MYGEYNIEEIDYELFYSRLIKIQDWSSVQSGTKIFDIRCKQPLWFDTFIEQSTMYDKPAITYLNSENKKYQAPQDSWYLWDKKIALQTLSKLLDKRGRDIVSICILNEDYEAVKYLLSTNSDPNVPDQDSRTPLFFTIEKSNFELFSLLLKNKANPHQKDIFGQSLLHYVSHKGENPDVQLKIAKELLALGLNINELDSEGFSPFITAASANVVNLELINLFIQSRADIDIRNADGFSALSLAVFHDRTKLAELLIERGADLNTKSLDSHYLAGLISSVEMYEVFERNKDKLSNKHWETLIKKRLSLLTK